MRAVRHEGPVQGVIMTREQPEPVLQAGEALLRPLRTAIGHAEVEVARCKPAMGPITLGRMFVGIVERIKAGESTGGVKPQTLVGKRVVGSINAVCGECEYCRGGLSNHCPMRTVLGLRGRDGCFADRFTLPISNLHVLPNSIDDDAALFIEPLAAAIHAAQQLRIEGKPYVTILGDGVMGLLCAQVMSRMNASVRLLGRSERKLEIAAKWGIKHRHDNEAGRRADQHIVIDCTGSTEGFDLALKLVRPRGKVLLKGSLLPGVSRPSAVDLAPIAASEIEVIGSRCGPFPEAISMLARGEVDTASLVTRRSKLDSALEALRAAANPDCVTVVMDV